MAIVAGWFGPLDGAEAALAPVRALGPVVDLTGPLPYLALQALSTSAVPHGMARYWKSGFFAELPTEPSTAIAAANDRKPTPISLELFFHQHGAVDAGRRRRTRRSLTARASWDFDALAQWSEPEQAEAGIAWARGLWDEMAPVSSGVYVNHLDADDRGRVGQAYGPNYERLVGLKQKYDPDNFFRINNNIVPA